MSGGLGNQLFQYAVARRLADTLGEDLEIDTRFFPQHSYGTTKGFWIAQLPIRSTVKKYPETGPLAPHAIIPRIKRKILDERIRPVYRENAIGFDPTLFSVKKNSILYGCFQSVKYLIPNDATLARELSPAHMMTPADRVMIESLLQAEVASVHVRRGDYLSLPGFGAENYENYLIRAMNLVAGERSAIRFLIFSDDIAWCQSSQIFKSRCDFYDAPAHRHPMLDLYIMSRCSHHIISNSSYSWWAAWLGDQPGKRVVAPSTWILGADSRKSGIIPDHWMTIT